MILEKVIIREALAEGAQAILDFLKLLPMKQVTYY